MLESSLQLPGAARGLFGKSVIVSLTKAHTGFSAGTGDLSKGLPSPCARLTGGLPAQAWACPSQHCLSSELCRPALKGFFAIAYKLKLPLPGHHAVKFQQAGFGMLDQCDKD